MKYLGYLAPNQIKPIRSIILLVQAKHSLEELYNIHNHHIFWIGNRIFVW